MAYTVPPLPYAYDALEPYVDEATMRVHHDKHHQAYVDKANAALEGRSLADRPVHRVLTQPDQLDDDRRAAVRNNAGGHAKHTLFWESMTPAGPSEPGGALAQGISAAYGPFERFRGARRGGRRPLRRWPGVARAPRLRPGGDLHTQTRTAHSRTAGRRSWGSTSGSTRTT